MEIRSLEHTNVSIVSAYLKNETKTC